MLDYKLLSFNKILVLLAALTTLFYTNVGFSSETPTKRISIIQVVEHPALDAARKGIIDTLQENDKKIQIDFQSAQGNAALGAQIAQKFVGSNPSVMVGIGTSVSQALVAADQKRNIPIVFSSVSDPLSAKLVNDLKKPGNDVTGVSDFIEPGLQFELFKKIMPKLTKIGIIYSPGESNSVVLNEKMKKVAGSYGLELIFAPANTSGDVPQATHSLMSRVQAIFINNDNIALSAFEAIVKIATQNNIPVFCSDIDMVEQGALAALGPNQYEVGKQVGKIILQILAGEKPGQIPVGFPEKTEIWINPLQAKTLKVEISKELMQKAKLVTNSSS